MGAGKDDERRNLRDKYGIFFDGPAEPTSWPITHHVLFSDIQKLGRKTYSQYVELRKTRPPSEPAGSQVLPRVDRVRSIADRRLRERRNEAGWRLSLEHEILARFHGEITWYTSLDLPALAYS